MTWFGISRGLSSIPGTTSGTAVACATFNLPMDYYTGDGYINNVPVSAPGGAYSHGVDINAAWDLLSPDDRLDLFAGHTVQNSYGIGDVAKSTLASNGIGYAVKYAGYEVALQRYADFESNGNYQPRQVHEMADLDRSYKMTRAYAQWMHTAGYDMLEYFTVDGSVMGGIRATGPITTAIRTWPPPRATPGSSTSPSACLTAAQGWLDYASMSTSVAFGSCLLAMA